MVKFTNEVLEEAENKDYSFQIGCYFSDSKRIHGALLLWSESIKDSYWNYATKINIDKNHAEELIKEVIDFYKSKNRQPAILFNAFTTPKDLPEIIKKLGFQSKYKSVSMFYEAPEPKITLPENFVISQVKTKDDMKLFVDVFNQSYGGATPEEPYGALPKEYGESLFESFSNQQKYKTINYIGILNQKPVSIATLIHSGKFGCIYNVGVVPSFRQKGFGSYLTLSVVKDSIKSGAEVVFLQTEQGSFNEKYFTGLGFSTKFVSEGFVLE